MKTVIKIPKEMRDYVNQYKPHSGSGLHVIEDIDGNAVISVEEFYSKEFQSFFHADVKQSVTDKAEEIPFKPKPDWTIEDIQKWADENTKETKEQPIK